jgi:hypothetical protein
MELLVSRRSRYLPIRDFFLWFIHIPTCILHNAQNFSYDHILIYKSIFLYLICYIGCIIKNLWCYNFLIFLSDFNKWYIKQNSF